jgi:glycosyltransferase involved in cell wall biosynthesis
MATATNNRHAVAAALLLGRRTVISVHSLAALDSAPQRWYLRRMMRAVRAAMVPARAIADQLHDALGLDARIVHIVRNGVAVTDASRPGASPPQDAVRIVTVGRLSPEKGHDVLVDACRDLVSRGKAVQMVIVGEGPQRGALEHQSRGLPVTLTGEVDDPQRLLAAADVYCQPARNEGLPLALLEGMMIGLPCVASAVGDIPSLTPDVVLVPPDDPVGLADALESLVDNPQRREALGAAARRRALADHTVEQLVHTVVAVYGEALR